MANVFLTTGPLRVTGREPGLQADGDGGVGADCQIIFSSKFTVFEISLQTVVLDLLAEAMIKAIDEGVAGFLLDAFPINMEQAEAFESFIGTPAKIIYLSLPQVT